MISIINFKEDLCIPEEKALELGVKYSTTKRLGRRTDEPDEPVQALQSYDKFKDECIEKNGKYYENEEKAETGVSVESYYLYTRYSGKENLVFVESKGHLVNLTTFAPWCKYPFYIVESMAESKPSVTNLQNLLKQVEDKTVAINETLESLMKAHSFNQKVNVHVGGGLITTYNDLMLKDDACTDAVQVELNNGWKIIAVCIQPDQRRPDYVLGRFNPKLNVTDKGRAER